MSDESGEADTWRRPPRSLSLDSGSVHVWRIPLEANASTVTMMQKALGEDEVSRARRFRFENHRRRFIMRRGALRHILSRYTGIVPGALEFTSTFHGRPQLSSQGNDAIQFSLSHSHELALLAVGRDASIGVDIEHMDTRRADRGVSEMFFAPEELAELNQLDASQWEVAFFNCWTRKEAYVKARGVGLSLPLDSFAVSVSLTDLPRFVMIRDQPDACQTWRIFSLFPGKNYMATLVADHPLECVTCFDYSLDEIN